MPILSKKNCLNHWFERISPVYSQLRGNLKVGLSGIPNKTFFFTKSAHQDKTIHYLNETYPEQEIEGEKKILGDGVETHFV